MLSLSCSNLSLMQYFGIPIILLNLCSSLSIMLHQSEGIGMHRRAHCDTLSVSLTVSFMTGRDLHVKHYSAQITMLAKSRGA